MRRIFLLSPAHCGGDRARLLCSARASFVLAERLRSGGAPIGEVFAFLSGLYFRGKLAYATIFTRPPAGRPGVLVIAPGRGLVPAATPIDVEDMRALARVPVDARDPRYRRPLEQDAHVAAATLGPRGEAILLGSVATGKYIDVLAGVFGGRLRFPAGFAGRGDMSRGGLLLRCVRDRRELEYVPVDGSPRRGPRPPRLEPWS